MKLGFLSVKDAEPRFIKKVPSLSQWRGPWQHIVQYSEPEREDGLGHGHWTLGRKSTGGGIRNNVAQQEVDHYQNGEKLKPPQEADVIILNA